MLENRITALVWTIRCSIILGIPFWTALTIWVCWDGKNLGLKVILGVVTGIFAIGYVMIRYMVELQTAQNYLSALQNKNFQEALTLGRSYYGLRRNGLKGAAGTYNTIYDEQSITNDIAAYSK